MENQNVPPVAQEAGINTNKKARPIKSLLLLILGVVFLLGVGFAVYKFLYPRVFNKKTSGGEIVWWGLWEDASVYTPLIAEYESQNPGVKITYMKQSKEQYRERLTNALAKGEGPDIFSFHNSWVPMFKSHLSSLPPDVMSVSEYSETFYPVVVSDLLSSQGPLGIPLGIDTLNLFVNKQIFDSNQKVYPASWDEFRVLGRELTVINDKGLIEQSGAALGRVENVDHWQEILALMLLQSGVNPKALAGAGTEKPLVYFTLFSTADRVWNETLPPSTGAFAAGKLAMYFAPAWRALEIMEANPTLQFAVIPVPQLPKAVSSQPDVNYATYWVQGVNAKSVSSEEAWKFLKFLSSKESLQKIYKNETSQRLFGEAYPRMDMQDLLAGDPFNGAVVSQIATAKSSYLYARTNDGATGINTQMGRYYEDAVSGLIKKGNTSDILDTLSSGVQQVLNQYGLSDTKPASR